MNSNSAESAERSDCYSETSSSVSDVTDIQSMVIMPLQHRPATGDNSEPKLTKDGRLQKKRGPKPKSCSQQPNRKRVRLSTSHSSKSKQVAGKSNINIATQGCSESGATKV